VILEEMVYTSDRYRIAETTYPSYSGYDLTIISGYIDNSDLFSLFSSFTYDSWIAISIILIISIIINSRHLPNYWTNLIRIVFFDHFSILLGKGSTNQLIF